LSNVKIYSVLRRQHEFFIYLHKIKTFIYRTLRLASVATAAAASGASQCMKIMRKVSKKFTSEQSNTDTIYPHVKCI